MLSLFWLHLFYNGWLDSSQNRDSKCLRINFSLIPLFYDHWTPTLTCFHTFLICNLFAYFHFRSLFPFFKIENFFYHLVQTNLQYLVRRIIIHITPIGNFPNNKEQRSKSCVPMTHFNNAAMDMSMDFAVE